MKNILLFIQFITIVCSKVINNYNLPSCKNCIHFKRSTSYPSFNYMAYCTYFDKENVHGTVKHERALDCRTDENKCGLTGKWFYNRKIYDNVFNHIIVPKIHKRISVILFVSCLIIRSVFS